MKSLFRSFVVCDVDKDSERKHLGSYHFFFEEERDFHQAILLSSHHHESDVTNGV